MQESDDRPRRAQLQDTGLVPFDPVERDDLDPIPPAPAPYVKEPLFNKRVMVVWAVGAFLVWFGVTQIVPIVFRSVRSTVIQTVRELENDGTIKITRSSDGKIIKIEKSLPGGAQGAPAPAAAPAAAPLPAAPAPAPEPVKAPEAKK